jgi:tetratricopeptide (TPR) repeat protein
MFRQAAFALSILAISACSRSSVNQKCADSRLDLAKEALGQLNLEAAETEANRSLACSPRNEVTHNVLGLIDFLRAVKNAQLLEVDECLDGVDAEALIAERDEHFAAADAHFTRAIELAPKYSEAWSNRGSVALQLEKYDRALAHFERALASPERLQNIGLTRAHFGWTHFSLGDYADAAKELRQANQFNPGMCVANYRLGRVYFARQEWKKAAERFKGSVESGSCRMQEAHLYLMRSQSALGLHEEADASRTSCVSLAPRSCVAMTCTGARGEDRVASEN